MVAAGLLEEVRNVLGIGYSEKIKSLQSLGYKQIIEFLQGKCDWQRAVELIKRDTWHYAKRQLTWFNADKEINWFDSGSFMRISDQIRIFLEQC
jgi:tRNA dimethylallyltransferase